MITASVKCSSTKEGTKKDAKKLAILITTNTGFSVNSTETRVWAPTRFDPFATRFRISDAARAGSAGLLAPSVFAMQVNLL